MSNILGEVQDLAPLLALVRARAPRCRVVVDGVAYAPHLPIDVQAWGVDWYVFSTYKVLGPHMAALYGSKEAWAELTAATEGPNHYFVDNADVVYKVRVVVCRGGDAGRGGLPLIGRPQRAASSAAAGAWRRPGLPQATRLPAPAQYELGGVSHEGCAALCALPVYLEALASAWAELGGSSGGGGGSSYGRLQRCTVLAAYGAMAAMERPLQEQLLAHLASVPDVTVVGPSGCAARVPTISFVHRHKPSPEIARALQQRGFALRHGHMYAHRLVSGLGLRGGAPPEEGVVRVSLLHYNTPEEVAGLIAALKEVL